ncbi:Retrovirus-related Pol polyprotein from transposon TNT 1-94 [Araneus ventricosus]|uniref:Retrovirus-related Pol polyprotein from transposon TNT 1-94 n=1 Tax=Araneus ventricosus TaxID=182803 RepID=A0A4Y2DB10_ARAVE|nr:Retrovirus-related Pol polyprotein from transposon TNT 1-94 [Araneus ventricosus]
MPQSRGINIRYCMPYTPEQNGAAERENRIIVEAARSIFHHKCLPLKLWAEAVNTGVYALNRTGPTREKGKTHIELWSGSSFNVGYLNVFGTKCFVHVPKQRRQKLDPKSVAGFFVGYCGEKDGCRVVKGAKRDHSE